MTEPRIKIARPGPRLRTDPRTPGITTMAGSVKLLRNQRPVPGQNGIRLGPLRDVFQRFASKPFGNLGQRDSLRIRKPLPHRQMAAQNPILCDQVLVAEQQIPTLSRTPGGVPSGIDRAWWNVHHNDGRSEIILRSSILAERACDGIAPRPSAPLVRKPIRSEIGRTIKQNADAEFML